ncbi:hypothetical protein OH77DRAFT_1183954 [Trametes cingulata]|nr:hypothetical protein OH77DRAFT_1183954 [Trametes cingulata]
MSLGLRRAGARKENACSAPRKYPQSSLYGGLVRPIIFGSSLPGTRDHYDPGARNPSLPHNIPSVLRARSGDIIHARPRAHPAEGLHPHSDVRSIASCLLTSRLRVPGLRQLIQPAEIIGALLRSRLPDSSCLASPDRVRKPGRDDTARWRFSQVSLKCNL